MRAAAFSVLLIWTLSTLGGHSMSPEQVLDQTVIELTPREVTGFPQGHKLAVFNIDLFTTTLPVCAFHSRLNTKPVSQGCVLLKGVSSAEFSFSAFLCKEKKRPKKVTHFKCFTN